MEARTERDLPKTPESSQRSTSIPQKPPWVTCGNPKNLAVNHTWAMPSARRVSLTVLWAFIQSFTTQCNHPMLTEYVEQKRASQGSAEELIYNKLRESSAWLSRVWQDRNNPQPLPYSIFNILQGGTGGLFLKVLKIIHSGYILQPLGAQSKDIGSSSPPLLVPLYMHKIPGSPQYVRGIPHRTAVWLQRSLKVGTFSNKA